MPQRPRTVEATPYTAEQEAIEKTWAEYWRKASQELPLQSIARVEDAARQMIALTGSLQGLFLAVVAFSDLRNQLRGFEALAFLVPVLLWMGSLWFATQVFVPRERQGANRNDLRPEAWEELRETVEDALKEKQRLLNRAHALLLASYVVAVVLMGYWLVNAPPPSEPPPANVVVLTPTPLPPTSTAIP